MSHKPTIKIQNERHFPQSRPPDFCLLNIVQHNCMGISLNSVLWESFPAGIWDCNAVECTAQRSPHRQGLNPTFLECVIIGLLHEGHRQSRHCRSVPSKIMPWASQEVIITLKMVQKLVLKLRIPALWKAQAKYRYWTIIWHGTGISFHQDWYGTWC